MPPCRKWTRCWAIRKSSSAEAYADFGIGSAERVRVNDIMSVRETAPQMVDHFEGRTRAFLQVQNGCDHRCTFCIIPYGRGNSRSGADGRGGGEARRLAENGFAEIVLTGVDLTSYGADLPGSPTLGQLVAKLLKLVPELKRLRLSSIDSIEADPELMRAIAEEERLMPHFHLSVQSGDDMILKRMKRRHSRADTIAFCETVRRLRPEAAFGADLIAGFPTETEAMFENSLKLVDDAGLIQLHVFPFSPRNGTPAARMPQLGRGRRARSAAPACAPRARRRAQARFRALIGKTPFGAGGKARLRPHANVSRRSRFEGASCARQHRRRDDHRHDGRPSRRHADRASRRMRTSAKRRRTKPACSRG